MANAVFHLRNGFRPWHSFTWIY